MSNNIEMPKTLPRKKQLCKLCRDIVHPNDKRVHEERTYHKLCLGEQLEDKQELTKGEDSKTEDNKQNVITNQQDNQREDSEPNENKVENLSIVEKLSESTNSINNLNNESSDKFFEFLDDKLSLKSLEEKIEEINLNEIDSIKNEIKKSCVIILNDNPNSLNIDEDNQLKSVSSNLSSLNPFEEEDEFYDELNPFDSLEKIDQHQDKVSIQSSSSSGIKINDNLNKTVTKEEKSYPKDLNPFEEDEDENDLEEIDRKELEDKKSTSNLSSNEIEKDEKIYPKELNPFDENDETIENASVLNDTKLRTSVNKDYLVLKNFSTSSLERFKENRSNQNQQFKSFSNLRVNRNSFNQNYDTLSVRSLTPDGKWKSNKKKKAPKPPTNQHQSQQLNSLSVTASSVNTSPTTPSPILDKKSYSDNNHREYTACNESISYHSSESENENSFISLTNSEISESKENILNQQIKRYAFAKKKNRAPLPPTPLIRFVNSVEEIKKECDEIGDKLLINSNSINEIELKFVDDQKKKELSKSTIKKLIHEWLCLIETKCLLAKRQEELSYMKCQNRIEKDQVEVDSQLRILYNKEPKLKTFEDLKLEEDLLEKLIDLVERKNELEENIIKIDKSDEFNKSVQKIKELVDNAIFDPAFKDFQKNYFIESNIRNNLLAETLIKKKKTKKHDKKGFTLKKLAKKLT